MLTKLARDIRGAALIEAALVLPALLVLVFGMTDLSLYLWRQHLGQKAVQLGLRKAVVSASVASGPGLTIADSVSYWDGMAPGALCTLGANSPCPVFAVRCAEATGCLCAGSRCGFTLSPSRLAPILAAMRSVLPELRADQVEIGYATNGLGYVGRPVPVPVDVTVRIVGLFFRPAVTGQILPVSIPIRAAAVGSSEILGADR